MDSVVIIDLSAIFWRIWHANESNEVNEARRRTIALVEEVAREHDFCAVAVDHPPYKRKAIYGEYKAGREHSPQGVEELRNAIVGIGKIGITCYSVEGYEADDVIATLAQQANATGEYEVFVAGSDKDLLQVANIRLFNPFDKKEKTALETFGCTQEQVVDVLALMGDKADNIPGLPSIGAVKAMQILAIIKGVLPFIHLSEDAKLVCYNKMKPAMREAIENNIDSLELSLKLVQLHYNVPVVLTYVKYVESEVSEPQPIVAAGVIGAVENKEVAVVKKTDALITADVRNATWSLALEPDDLNATWALCKSLHESRMFGQFPNPQAILAIVMRGRELGIGSTTALTSFHVIKGKPTMSADLMLGLILNSGRCLYFDMVESTEKISSYITKRVGAKREVALSYTIEEAATARLTTGGNDSNWVKRPKTMMRKRCISELARIVYPDIVTGLYTPEEMEEI